MRSRRRWTSTGSTSGATPRAEEGAAPAVQPVPEEGACRTIPWGRPYVYRAPGQKGEFDLLSYGRDGKAGGTGEDADISLNR